MNFIAINEEIGTNILLEIKTIKHEHQTQV